MRIIDAYLLNQFLRTFLICFCSLTGLYIVIDGFSNLDDFMLYAEKHGSLLTVMGEYYAFRSMSFFDRTSGILTLIAAMFTVTAIQSHQELTALEAAGMSKGRVVKPVIVAVIVISLLAALNRELVIPRIRGKLSHNAQNLNGRKAQAAQPRYDNETEVLFGGSETNAEEQSITSRTSFCSSRSTSTASTWSPPRPITSRPKATGRAATCSTKSISRNGWTSCPRWSRTARE